MRDQVFKIIPRLYKEVKIEELDDPSYGAGMLFGFLGADLVKLFSQGQVKELEISELLGFFEQILNQKTEDPNIDYAITVYFIESYTNQIMRSAEENPALNVKALTKPLGPKCLEYAQGIDKFWGSRTPGISENKKSWWPFKWK